MLTAIITKVRAVLVAAGIPSEAILEGREAHTRRTVAPRVIIVRENEQFTPDGSKVGRSQSNNGDGLRQTTMRTRAHVRTTPVAVAFDMATAAEAEAALEALLAGLGTGFTVADGEPHGGNRIRLVSATAEWPDDASVLRKSAAVDVSLTFEGGIYSDVTRRIFTEASLTSVAFEGNGTSGTEVPVVPPPEEEEE